MNLHVHMNRRSNSNSPAVAAVAASSVVFKETTISVNTVQSKHDVAGLCSPLRGGALIAAPHGDVNVGDVNVGEHEALELYDTAGCNNVDCSIALYKLTLDPTIGDPVGRV